MGGRVCRQRPRRLRGLGALALSPGWHRERDPAADVQSGRRPAGALGPPLEGARPRRPSAGRARIRARGARRRAQASTARTRGGPWLSAFLQSGTSFTPEAAFRQQNRGPVPGACTFDIPSLSLCASEPAGRLAAALGRSHARWQCGLAPLTAPRARLRLCAAPARARFVSRPPPTISRDVPHSCAPPAPQRTTGPSILYG